MKGRDSLISIKSVLLSVHVEHLQCVKWGNMGTSPLGMALVHEQ
jgi:hypothetical protein